MRVTVAPSTTRSEFAAEPPMAPVTLKAPVSKVSVVPFLLRAPERVRSPPPVFWIVPVPEVTEIVRLSVVVEPV